MKRYNAGMNQKRLYKALMGFLLILVAAALLFAIYFLPPVHDRLSWRLSNLRSQIYYYFNPPGEIVFSPVGQAEMEAILHQTQTAMAFAPTETPEPTITPEEIIQPTPTLTPSPTTIPEAFQLEGIIHEFQSMNNCGPATLSMALSFWGWEGDQRDTKAWLRLHPDDRNVMPEEMVAFVRERTNLNALKRWDGDIEMLKKLIAAGFPVIIERDMGDIRPTEDWTGHYGVAIGYDDAAGRLIFQDSYVGADYPLAYEKIQTYWRAFNYVYVVIYPPTREAEIHAILGPHIDETYNLEQAAQTALQETTILDGRDLFFAWFNYGTSLVNLGDYFGAAQAYDHAYQVVYQQIPLPARPWRMLWYQTGPYHAYYTTGRYQDVHLLADNTFADTGVREIEETWYWRGRAWLALGETEKAIADFREALRYRPGWTAAENKLRDLGIDP